jgi:hypothetical protein
MGILTVGVVTKPFPFEGQQRMRRAEEGLREMRENVDTLITIPNQRLLGVVDRKTTLLDSFRMADDILRQAVAGISDLVTVPGLVNVDFADVRTIMSRMGRAVMGVGIGRGDNRAVEAAQRAISSPLLEDGSIDGAQAVLINVTCGPMALRRPTGREHRQRRSPDAQSSGGGDQARSAETSSSPSSRRASAEGGADTVADGAARPPGRPTNFETPAYLRRQGMKVVGMDFSTTAARQRGSRHPTFLRRQAD